MKVIGRQVFDEGNEAPIASSEASAILEAEDGKENQDVNQPAKRWENLLPGFLALSELQFNI